jgi:hypothetical protein
VFFVVEPRTHDSQYTKQSCRKSQEGVLKSYFGRAVADGDFPLTVGLLHPKLPAAVWIPADAQKDFFLAIAIQPTVQKE